MANLLSNLGPESSAPASKPTLTSRQPRKIDRPQRPKQRSSAHVHLTLTEPSQQITDLPTSNGNKDISHKAIENDLVKDDDYGFDDMDMDMDMDFDNIKDDVEPAVQVKKEVTIKTEDDDDTSTTKTVSHLRIKEEPRDPTLQDWQSTEANVKSDILDATPVTEDPATLKLLENDGSLHFWWYDAYEHREKGSVYLFGKV
jgi:DNA polymerase alpha subunit A